MACRHIFIINPASGKSDPTEYITAAVSKSLSGIPYELIETKYPRHATELVRDLCKSGDDLRIYSCGGDGTLSEIVNGIYRAGCPKNAAVGCVPVGSGNDFIRYFEDISTEAFLDIGRQASGRVIPIDLLEVGGKVSVNIISAGYDAAVCANLQKFKKIPLVSGSMAYNMAAAYCLVSHMKNRYTLYADGVPTEEGSSDFLFALAANGRYYGGGFKAAPYAQADDTYIDFLRVPTVSRFKFARLVGDFRRGLHLEKYDICRLTRCRSAKITSPDYIDVNIDGEIYKMKDPEIKILPHSLNFILPA